VCRYGLGISTRRACCATVSHHTFLFFIIYFVSHYTLCFGCVCVPGWLREMGVLDFAGGAVVHTTAGFSALVASAMVCFSLYILFLIIHFVFHYTFVFSLYILFRLCGQVGARARHAGEAPQSGSHNIPFVMLGSALVPKNHSEALTIFLLSHTIPFVTLYSFCVCWDQPWYLRTTVRLSQYSFCYILFLLLHNIPFVYVGISLGTPQSSFPLFIRACFNS
jgi:hypothetical protein